MTAAPTSSPLHVIACEPPAFTAAEIRDIARRHYGLDASVAPLVSERDQNWRLSAATGDFVLKIANAAEDPAVTDFQIRALAHLAREPRSAPPVPRVCPTRDGADRLELAREGATHVARLVTWLPGRPLRAADLAPRLCRQLGETLARLGRSLEDFRHPGGTQSLLWDMKRAGALREILPRVADADRRQLLAQCLDDFEARALPLFPRLRSQVIHSDFNPANVLLQPGPPPAVSGVIDFGDLQHAPLVVDVAIAAAYLRNEPGDPLEHIAPFVAGYHAVTPLTPEETGLLFDLVSTRLATTVALLEWRRAARASGDAYLEAAAAAEAGAGRFLERLRALSREAVGRRLAAGCAP